MSLVFPSVLVVDEGGPSRGLLCSDLEQSKWKRLWKSNQGYPRACLAFQRLASQAALAPLGSIYSPSADSVSMSTAAKKLYQAYIRQGPLSSGSAVSGLPFVSIVVPRNV
jgi:hypothetical protein